MASSQISPQVVEPQTLQGTDNIADLILYSGLALGFLVSLTFFGIFSPSALLNLKRSKSEALRNGARGADRSNKRCIVQRMEDTNKNCVVFFGSQTGNAQDFAEKLAKEGASRYGLRTIVADLDEYDYETLHKLDKTKVAVFVLSSYGEGEPTDNAVGFYDFIACDSPAFSLPEEEDLETPLRDMYYGVFGLGNSTYEHYNSVVRRVDESFQHLGATRIANVGEGDDAKGTTEDSFIAWKDSFWKDLSSAMGLEEHESRFEASFIVTEVEDSSDSVYLGERSEDELLGKKIDLPGPHNPSIVKVIKSQELFHSQDRSCLHLEMDLKATGLSYQTGDHAAIWPVNADAEVDRFLRVFGLLEKRNTSITISTTEPTVHSPIPSPTTYNAAVRYYLEIAGPVSRQSLHTMSHFAVDQSQKEMLLNLSKDKEYFHRHASSPLLNLAQLIELISPTNPNFSIPFAVLLECVRALQPRYYSISSSSLVQADVLSCTVVAESAQLPERQFKGVASNYLLALKNQQNTEPKPPNHIEYNLLGPRSKYDLSISMHIRQSTFRLPVDSSRPIVMVGPGTGVAPFRGFLLERAAQWKTGLPVGRSLLFYGCRTASEDFIYQEEWEVSFKPQSWIGENLT